MASTSSDSSPVVSVLSSDLEKSFSKGGLSDDFKRFLDESVSSTESEEEKYRKPRSSSLHPKTKTALRNEEISKSNSWLKKKPDVSVPSVIEPETESSIKVPVKDLSSVITDSNEVKPVSEQKATKPTSVASNIFKSIDHLGSSSESYEVDFEVEDDENDKERSDDEIEEEVEPDQDSRYPLERVLSNITEVTEGTTDNDPSQSTATNEQYSEKFESSSEEQTEEDSEEGLQPDVVKEPAVMVPIAQPLNETFMKVEEPIRDSIINQHAETNSSLLQSIPFSINMIKTGNTKNEAPKVDVGRPKPLIETSIKVKDSVTDSPILHEELKSFMDEESPSAENLPFEFKTEVIPRTIVPPELSEFSSKNLYPEPDSLGKNLIHEPELIKSDEDVAKFNFTHSSGVGSIQPKAASSPSKTKLLATNVTKRVKEAIPNITAKETQAESKRKPNAFSHRKSSLKVGNKLDREIITKTAANSNYKETFSTGTSGLNQTNAQSLTVKATSDKKIYIQRKVVNSRPTVLELPMKILQQTEASPKRPSPKKADLMLTQFQKLKKDHEHLEALMKGYENENVKLNEEVKKLKVSTRSSQLQLRTEKEKATFQLTSLKEKVEQMELRKATPNPTSKSNHLKVDNEKLVILLEQSKQFTNELQLEVSKLQVENEKLKKDGEPRKILDLKLMTLEKQLSTERVLTSKLRESQQETIKELNFYKKLPNSQSCIADLETQNKEIFLKLKEKDNRSKEAINQLYDHHLALKQAYSKVISEERIGEQAFSKDPTPQYSNKKVGCNFLMQAEKRAVSIQCDMNSANLIKDENYLIELKKVLDKRLSNTGENITTFFSAKHSPKKLDCLYCLQRLESQTLKCEMLEQELKEMKLHRDSMTKEMLNLKSKNEHLYKNIQSILAGKPNEMYVFLELEKKIEQLQEIYEKRESELSHLRQQLQEHTPSYLKCELARMQQLVIEKNNQLEKCTLELDSLIYLLHDLVKNSY